MSCELNHVPPSVPSAMFNLLLTARAFSARIYHCSWIVTQMQQDQEQQHERVCVAPEHWEDFEACAEAIGTE